MTSAEFRVARARAGGSGLRCQNLIRVLRLMRFLEETETRWTWLELAARFGVRRRTIRRDLEALQSAGATVERGRDDYSGETLIGRLTWG